MGIGILGGEGMREKDMPPSGSLKVFMKAMKAAKYILRMNKEDTILARRVLEEAIDLDPEYAPLYSFLGMTHLMDLYFQSSESHEISFAQASKNIKKALALDDRDYLAHFVLNHLYWLRKEPDKAIAALERAIELNPNGADAYATLGNWFTFTGKTEEGIKLIDKAIRLNPVPPPLYLAEICAHRQQHHVQNLLHVLQPAPSPRRPRSPRRPCWSSPKHGYDFQRSSR